MKKRHLGSAVLILLIMFVQCLYFAWDTGQTIDETFYNGSGYAMVRYNDYQRLGEHPPLVMQLGSLPLLFLHPNYPYEDPVYIDDSRQSDRVDLSRTGSKFLYKMGNDPQLILFLERIPVILITLLGGFFVFRWGYELFGFSSALVTLVLYTFSSNMIANGSLFTTDMAVAIFFFVSIYFTHRIFISSPLRNAIYAGIFSGLTLLSKMSGLVLIPAIFALFCLAPVLQPELKNKTLPNIEPLNKFLGLFSPLLFLCALSQKIVGVALGPLCLVGTELTLLKKFESHRKTQWVIRGLVAIGWILLLAFIIRMLPKRPLPMLVGLSSWYLVILILSRFLSRPLVSEGIVNLAKLFLLTAFVCTFVIMIDFTDNFTSIGRLNFFRHYVRSFNIAFGHIQTDHKLCLPGSFVTCDWRYFITSLSIKTPLATLVLFALGLLVLLKSKSRSLVTAHLIVPPLIFLFAASVFNRINLGIKHVLAVYPFMFLIAGVPMSYLKQVGNQFLRKVGHLVVGVMCLWVVFQNWVISPHHLTYFNEFVRTPENGAKVVSGSNLNMGHDNRRLTEVVNALRIPTVKIAATAANGDEYDYYRISWEPMREEDFVRPAPGYYAIDLATYTHLQHRKDSWFRNRKPSYYAGKTFYLFKV